MSRRLKSFCIALAALFTLVAFDVVAVWYPYIGYPLMGGFFFVLMFFVVDGITKNDQNR